MAELKPGDHVSIEKKRDHMLGYSVKEGVIRAITYHEPIDLFDVSDSFSAMVTVLDDDSGEQVIELSSLDYTLTLKAFVLTIT